MRNRRASIPKEWVIIKFNDGRLKVWRNYDGDIWGSSIYQVLDYFTGSYRDAKAQARRELRHGQV